MAGAKEGDLGRYFVQFASIGVQEALNLQHLPRPRAGVRFLARRPVYHAPCWVASRLGSPFSRPICRETSTVPLAVKATAPKAPWSAAARRRRSRCLGLRRRRRAAALQGASRIFVAYGRLSTDGARLGCGGSPLRGWLGCGVHRRSCIRRRATKPLTRPAAAGEVAVAGHPLSTGGGCHMKTEGRNSIASRVVSC